MIRFSEPLLLLLILPWAVMVVLVWRSGRRALDWLSKNVDAGRLAVWTRSTPNGLTAHLALIFAMGALLIGAAAGPWAPGLVETQSTGSTVILVLDASLSMGAGDAGFHPATGEDFGSRFDLARTLCLELTEMAPEMTFGLVSFSGAAVIHSPPTRDLQALRTLLKTLRYHYYSQSMGTRFSSAFDAVIHLMADRNTPYQVVLLSDGELPEKDETSDGLVILKAAGVPVHTVAVGSLEWQEMTVYVLSDILSGAEEKRTAGEYRTRRDDRTLAKISKATGGRALVFEYGAWVEDLAEAIRASTGPQTRRELAGRRNLAAYPLVLFLVLLIIEWTFLAPRPGPSAHRPPPWRRSATLVALVVTSLAVSGCHSPLLRAYANNEKGIEKQRADNNKGALADFERSAAFGVREHVPTYNRGNSLLALGDLTSAHDAYQRAIVLQPRNVRAAFNDGHTLYRWGAEEIDPQGCELERTRALWRQAIERFTSVAEIRGSRSRLGREALDNVRAIEDALAQLDILAQSCPEPPAEASSSGGGQSGSGDEDGEPPQAPPPPLSDQDRDHIAEELERMRTQAESVKTFRQTRETQLEPDSAEAAGGQKIKW